MGTTQVSLVQATVTKNEATNLTVIEESVAALAALISGGQLAVKASLAGGVGTPQADAVTSGAGWLAAVTIPTGTKFIDFLLDAAAYVVADATSDSPAANGVPYQPNLNFRLPCCGCTKLHLRRVGGSDATMKWNAIA